MKRQGNKMQMSAAQCSSGGDARGDSHKLSRKEKKLPKAADARETGATVSSQEQRIAQLEEQLKAAVGTIKQMAESSGNQQGNWSWDSWASWWNSEEPATKRSKDTQ